MSVMSKHTQPMIISLFELIQSKQLVPEPELKRYQTQTNAVLFEDLKRYFHINESYLLQLISEAYQWPIKTAQELILDPRLLKDHAPLLADFTVPIYKDTWGIGLLTHNPFQKISLSNADQTIDFYLMEKDQIVALIDQKSPTKMTQSTHDCFEDILKTAIKKKASDIHFFSTQKQGQIVFRIDGELLTHQSIPLTQWKPLLSLIKYLAHLDISIYTKPQDGFIDFERGTLRCHSRVSCIPSLYGEDIVLRLFEQYAQATPLNQLAFNPHTQDLIKSILKQQQGVFLVTGPTGSGKTSTLYSCLQHLKSQSRLNIISLEDPIEMAIPGVRQCPVTDQNLSFSDGLRAALRQDPDVILIGEVRDAKTAKIVFEAAYTGHLILSSLHTGSVHSSLLRLSSFDIDPFLINQALLGILSQQLVPKSCPNCQRPHPLHRPFQENDGCEKCLQKGFQGRLLISELLSINTDTPFNILDPKPSIKAHHFNSFKDDITDKLTQSQLSWSLAESLLEKGIH